MNSPYRQLARQLLPTPLYQRAQPLYRSFRQVWTAVTRRLKGQSNTWWDARDPEYLRDRFLRDPVDGIDHPSRRWLRAWLTAHPGLRLLDIPCGPGVEYEGFQRDQVPVHYLGMDATDTMLTTCWQKFPDMDIRKGDITRIPLPDRAVDVVLCRHILEHLDDYRPAVREAVRVARQKVFVVLFRVPTHEERRAIGQGAWDNRINGSELAALLESLGCSFTTTQLPYGYDVPEGIEENVIIEVTIPETKA
ncbi:MAG: methyltransferase domain-containing protein [Deltaproteobacteria bacterium]|nr:methyltransferase domain-containing protein [Deltaproteobacteria bacterium]